MVHPSKQAVWISQILGAQLLGSLLFCGLGSMDSCCMDRSCARWITGITEGWKLYHSMQLGLLRDGLQCHLPHRKHTGEGSADVAVVDRAWVGLKGLKGPPNVDFGSFLKAKPTFLGTQFSDPSPKWFVFADRACLLKCHDWTRFKTWL